MRTRDLLPALLLAVALAGCSRAPEPERPRALLAEPGLAVIADPNGKVTSLKVAGTEYASSSLPSGFSVKNVSGGAVSVSSATTQDGLDRVKVTATVSTASPPAAFELTYRLPVSLVGWTWDKDLTTSAAIAAGSTYSDLDPNYKYYAKGHTHSNLPVIAARNATTAFGLACETGKAIVYRLAASTTNGLSVTWDLGLSRNVPKTVTFWVYGARLRSPNTQGAGLRQLLASFPPEKTTAPQGAWVLHSGIGSYANPEDFGWVYDEGPKAVAYDKAHSNMRVTYYVDPAAWFRKCGTTKITDYATIVGWLTTDAAKGVALAKATLNSGTKNASGRWSVLDDSYFQYGPFNGAYYQLYPNDADPSNATPNIASVITGQIDSTLASCKANGYAYAGPFIDDLSPNFGRLEDFRSEHLATADDPLSYSWVNQKVCKLHAQGMAEYLRYLRGHLVAPQNVIQGNTDPGAFAWFAPYLDVIGGEIGDSPNYTVNGAEIVPRTNIRRALSRGKVWTNLATYNMTAAQLLGYLRQGLSYGYWPGADSRYWGVAANVTRDRAAWKKYTPLIRRVTEAGWEPETGAAAGSLHVERFGKTLLTVQNAGTASVSGTLSLSGSVWGFGAADSVSLSDLTAGTAAKTAAVSGGTATLPVTVAAGDTLLFDVTVTPGATPNITSNLVPNGSFEEGAPSGWYPSNVPNATWAVSTDAIDGSKSMCLTMAGSTPFKSGNLNGPFFLLSPGKAYTFSFRTKAQGVSGAYPVVAYVRECDASNVPLLSATGANLQHGLRADLGTAAWNRKTVTFTTDARCAAAHVYANGWQTLGSTWLDDVKVEATP